MDNRKFFSELEDEFLKEGFVTTEDMASAKETLRQNYARAQKPLGLLIGDIALIPQDMFKNLMKDKRVHDIIGASALKKGMITHDQLEECRKEKDSLGAVLVRKGYLTEANRKILLQLTLEDIAFAKTGIANGLISEQNLEKALKLKSHQKSICEILYDRNLVTLSELNHVFRKFSKELKLGQILVLQELLSETQLKEALDEQATSSMTLGKILLNKRFIAIEQLYFALSIQYNTPFQKLDGYMYYEKQKVVLRDIVGQGYALENHILPLFLNGNNLTLAVSNPADIWSMHGLKSLYPEFQMTCVLITDEKFIQLYAMLYGELLCVGAMHQPGRTGASTPDESLQLYHPAEQKALMKRLYEEYRYYQDSAGLKAIDDEETLFVTFIEEQHHQICNQYQCKEVLFRFEINDGRTGIFASPVK